MKTTTMFAIAAAVALCPLATAFGQDQTIESMPPVVVKTVPESGVQNVAPGEMEIKVTFSKQMADGSWSWSTAWQNSGPEMVGKPRYEADGKTCVVKVKLEPGKTYAYWLNSQNFHNFRDRQGHSAVPYLLIFHTRSTTANLERGRDSGEVLREKIQLAETGLKTAGNNYQLGLATQADYEEARSAVTVAQAEYREALEAAKHK